MPEGAFNTPRIDSATAEKLIAMHKGPEKPTISGGAETSEGREEPEKKARRKREKKPELTKDQKRIQAQRANAMRGQPHEKKEGGYEFAEGSTLIEQAYAENAVREVARNAAISEAESAAAPVDRGAPDNLPVGDTSREKNEKEREIDSAYREQASQGGRMAEVGDREFQNLLAEIRLTATMLYERALRHFGETGEIKRDSELERTLNELEDRAADLGKKFGVTGNDISNFDAEIAREVGFSEISLAGGRRLMDLLGKERKKYPESKDVKASEIISHAEQNIFKQIEADGRPVVEQLKDVLRGAIQVAKTKAGTKDFFDPAASPHVRAVRKYAERVARMDPGMVSQVINEVLAEEGFDYNELLKTPPVKTKRERRAEKISALNQDDLDDRTRNSFEEEARQNESIGFGRVHDIDAAMMRRTPEVEAPVMTPVSPEPAPEPLAAEPERASGGETPPEDLRRALDEARRHLIEVTKNPGSFTPEARRLAEEQYKGAAKNYLERK